MDCFAAQAGADLLKYRFTESPPLEASGVSHKQVRNGLDICTAIDRVRFIPQKRTSADEIGMSAKGQKQTAKVRLSFASPI
jgi:hypothetical protein